MLRHSAFTSLKLGTSFDGFPIKSTVTGYRDPCMRTSAPAIAISILIRCKWTSALRRQSTLDWVLRIQKTELTRHFITAFASSFHLICCSQISVNILMNRLVTPSNYYVEIISRSYYYTGIDIYHVKI